MHVTTPMKEKCAQNAINLSIGLLTIIKTEFALLKRMIVKSMDDASVCHDYQVYALNKPSRNDKKLQAAPTT